MTLKGQHILDTENKHLSTIDNKILDRVNSLYEKSKKKKRFCTINKKFLKEEIPDKEDLMHPVYITTKERNAHNDTRNKTKETIRINNESYIKKVVCQHTRESFCICSAIPKIDMHQWLNSL